MVSGYIGEMNVRMNNFAKGRALRVRNQWGQDLVVTPEIRPIDCVVGFKARRGTGTGRGPCLQDVANPSDFGQRRGNGPTEEFGQTDRQMDRTNISTGVDGLGDWLSCWYQIALVVRLCEILSSYLLLTAWRIRLRRGTYVLVLGAVVVVVVVVMVATWVTVLVLIVAVDAAKDISNRMLIVCW